VAIDFHCSDLDCIETYQLEILKIQTWNSDAPDFTPK